MEESTDPAEPDVLPYPLPDVLAFPLDEARAVLDAAGFQVEVEETHPPRGGRPVGTARVVRQRIDGRWAALTVTYEWYEGGPPRAGNRPGTGDERRRPPGSPG